MESSALSGALWLGGEWRGGAGGMVQLRPFRVWWVKGGSPHPLSKCFISHQHLTGARERKTDAPPTLTAEQLLETGVIKPGCIFESPGGT